MAGWALIMVNYDEGEDFARCSLVSLYWRESLSESLARIKLGAGEDGIDADELGSIELRGRGLGEGQAGGTNPLSHPSAPRTASTPSRQKQIPHSQHAKTHNLSSCAILSILSYHG